MVTANPYATNNSTPTKKAEAGVKHTFPTPVGAKTQKGSRKARADIKISGTKSMRKPNYYIKVDALAGNLEVYWIQVDANNDAYQAHLHKAIEEDPFWHNLGFVAVARRRHSPKVNEFLVNTKDQYPRKVMVRVLEPDEESTVQGRQKTLHHIRNFCMVPSNNRFSYDYIVDDESDLTPEIDIHRARCDSYLQDFIICNLIKGLYDKVDKEWYTNNEETAHYYWSGPDYPEIALNELGYPRVDRQQADSGAFVTTYNSVAESNNSSAYVPHIPEPTVDDVPRRSGRNRKPATMPLPPP